ncbi:hypothetical protein [Pseudogemmobacter bohemicus]|uniref:hypothetical protein n=1 Tax=Pseudogemmobacter bohemicus TaxID=2250708 RepID=UPI001300B2BF|nr:hypothetical protein [Pseudogemmobacter bohemicus]
MAILALADFYDRLKINSYSFEMNENIVSSQDGAGQVLTSHVGPRLWRGSISCSTVSRNDVRALNALLQTIQNPNVLFEVTDFNSQYPASFNTSDNLNAVALSNPVAGYAAKISGLPTTYVLNSGDYFSLTHNGVKRIYKIAIGATASAGVANVTLLNPLPAGLANNISINLKRPVVTAKYVPGSMNAYSIGLDRADGASFNWVQALRT